MIEAPVQAATTRRRARRIVLVLVGAVALSLVAIYASVWFAAGERIEGERVEVTNRLAAHRAERVSRPVFFGPPEEGNAWIHLASALEFPGQFSKAGEDVLEKLYNRSITIESTEAREVLAKLAPYLESLKRGLRISLTEPDRSYEWQIEKDAASLFRGWLICHHLSRLAKVLHEAGRTEEALDCVVLGWGLADRISVKGHLSHFQLSLESSRVCASSLHDQLALGGFSSAELKRLAEILDTMAASRPELWAACRMQDLMIRRALLEIHYKQADIREFGVLRPAMGNLFSTRIEVARHFAAQDRFMASLERILKLPRRERLAALRAAELHPHFSHLPSAMAIDDWNSIDLSLARLAVAIARHREDSGRYPAALGDLVPAYLPSIPTDEIQEIPFRYKTSPGWALVYTFGNDGDDDGGVEDSDFDGDGDVVWILKRRPGAAK